MRFAYAPSAALLGLALAACNQSDPTLMYKLGKLDEKIDAIGRKVDALQAAPGRPAGQPQQPQRPQPPQADPSAVYSVAIGDSPTRGPANAKVTIVEAADFA